MDLPFHLLESYSSLRVFFFGAVTALSFTGTGLWLLEKLTGKKLPLLIALPTGTLLGILVFSVLVQFSGFAHIATPSVLRIMWLVLILFGLYVFVSYWKRMHCLLFASLRRINAVFRGAKFSLFCALILIILLFSTLLVSLAPSTKIDELYYHMLVPLRLFQESALNYYREPWPAMMPHMHFQITAAPLYALGVVDALNVTSWWLGAIFAWFCATVVFRKSGDLLWALVVSLGLYAGMYAPVWFVTGGAGAVSVLSMAVLAFLALERREMIGCLGGFSFVLLVSILSTALAASKLSYLPFAVLCLTICSFSVWRGLAYKQTIKIALLAWSAWIVIYLPALLWTWVSSGYLLGVMQDPAFAQKIASTRLLYHSLHGFFTQIAIHFADHTPLVWGGCLLFLFSPTIRKKRSVWLTGVALLLFQGAIIALKLPRSPRFFGGLPHAVALYFWMDAARNVPALLRKLFASKQVKLAMLALMTPWFLVQLWYSAQFLPVVWGAEPVESFAERLIPMYEDFRKLDELLPEDAVLFVGGGRVPSVYFPCPILFEKSDIITGKQRDVFVFSPSQNEEFETSSFELVYENKAAKTYTFRTPGRTAILGSLSVYRLTSVAETDETK